MELWKIVLINQIIFINSSFYARNYLFDLFTHVLCGESMGGIGPYQSCMVILRTTCSKTASLNLCNLVMNILFKIYKISVY